MKDKPKKWKKCRCKKIYALVCMNCPYDPRSDAPQHICAKCGGTKELYPYKKLGMKVIYK